MRKRVFTREDDLAQRVRIRAERARLGLSAETAARLAAYVALLFRWNERMNLTALDDGDGGLDRLVIEPLLAARRIPSGSTSVVDVGSGGGSPAIPIKIARPRLFMRMVEAKTRKAAFLREAARRLNLAGTVIENCRWEELRNRPELYETHDALTVRAVRVNARVASGMQDLVKAGGVLLFFCRAGRSGIVPAFGPALVTGARLQLLESTTTGSDLMVFRKSGSR